MALVGGGGSPNVAGSNPAGTSSNISYVGNHSYGYSGLFEFDNSAFKAGLDFTSGPNYETARIYWGYPESSGDNILSQVKINGELIYSQYHNNTRQDFTNSPMYIELLVPAYSRIQIGALNGDGNLRDCFVTYSARVYA